MFVKDLMKTLTKMNLNGKSVKLVLPDGSVGNIDCLGCEDELYVFYYKPEASGLDAKQLLSHMEAEASNECWGDSPNFKGYIPDSTSKFADCLIAIRTGYESDGIMSLFCADSIVKKGSTLLIVSPTTDELRASYESIVNEEENERKRFEDRCYELYQLEWMMSHGKSLDDLCKAMLEYEQDMFDSEDFGDGEHGHNFDANDLERIALQARDSFFKRGFRDGNVFVSKAEFLKTEYLKPYCMNRLFETQAGTEADEMKALYFMYTANRAVDIFGFIDEMRALSDFTDFSCKDLKSIAEASEYDMSKVIKAHALLGLGDTRDVVINPTEFMIKAITKGWI